MKRILALILSILLFVAVLPVTALADSSEDRWLRQSIEEHYVKILEENETESLSGWCGTLASYQLYYLGVNSYPIMANGNDQYDRYLNRNFTDNGYRIKRYPADQYSLEEALNAITHRGTWNAYNILVGFQTTNTEAGAQFGHAVVIYGIVDGKVYFTESYGNGVVEDEGIAGVCSISQFAALYDSWTELEGVIVFGRRDYLDNCFRRSANMYVQVQREDPLYTEPCVPDAGEVDSRVVRTARKGEFLKVTAMYENTLGRYYYQVLDGETVCYLDAQRAKAVYFNAQDVTVSDLELPYVLTPGKDFTVKGKISSQISQIGAVTMTVTDSQGQIIMTHSRAKKSGTFDLAKDTFNKVLDFGILEEGLYTYTLTADVLSDYLEEGIVETNVEQITLGSAIFAVGDSAQLPKQGRVAPEFIADGWSQIDGLWRYYENAAPRTGWFCYDGVDYYLQEDGSVTTGWAEINGKDRYFASTGAMCVGWLYTQEGTFYLLKNGQKAIGWRTIEGQKFCFDENGIMLSGWQSVDETDYYFGENGQLLAKAIIEDETVTYEMMTEEEVEIPPLKRNKA